MRRREFIAVVGGSVAGWSLVAQAQRLEQIRKLGMLGSFTAEDPEGQRRLKAVEQALRKLGWIEGDNIHTETRFASDDDSRSRRYAEELVALAPEVLFASTSQSVTILQRVTHSIPIVFANVVDPVGAGLVTSLARPGGNTTGFTAFEYSISGKWLELLKELAPSLTRVVVLREPSLAAGIGQFAAIQTMASASSAGVELSVFDPRDPNEIERALAAFAREPNGGVIVTASPSALMHRDFIISLMNRHRLPAVYPFRYYTEGGGLASYGPDSIDVHRRAAAYIDRILKGEKPADLPVQAPTKYEFLINLKTAKAIGLSLPTALLARADEVIE